VSIVFGVTQSVNPWEFSFQGGDVKPEPEDCREEAQEEGSAFARQRLAKLYEVDGC
jgi:hypothetical protein